MFIMRSSQEPANVAEATPKDRQGHSLLNLAREHALNLKAKNNLSVEEVVADFLGIAFGNKNPEALKKMQAAIIEKIKSDPRHLETLDRYYQNLRKYLDYWQKYLRILESFENNP